MEETHEGICGTHIGGRSLATKVLRAGYYWLTLRKDCLENGNATAAKGTKKKVAIVKGQWAELIPEILWGYNTTPQSLTKETPFRLMFGSDAMIPVKISQGSIRTIHLDEDTNEETRRSELDTLEETREESRAGSEAIQLMIQRKYNKKVRPRTFREGDLVLRRLEDVRKPKGEGKLATNWEGPFRVTRVLGRGAYSLQTLDGADLPNTWNITSL
ncbi:uncharacterized protein LOC130981250 [Arachis stenosperma]|uniref:uncharacterized protein LOC130981250 n=1 Tax=Arachis stenosperma TaxID=217475 RepID=UPI0025AC1B0D|nr:uncharacterized protein LOC130981250 [Arachis stenosperma]